MVNDASLRPVPYVGCQYLKLYAPKFCCQQHADSTVPPEYGGLEVDDWRVDMMNRGRYLGQATHVALETRMIQILGQAVDKAAGDVQPTTSKAGVRARAEIKLRARVRVPLFCV